jgi:hypothetical protein
MYLIHLNLSAATRDYLNLVNFILHIFYAKTFLSSCRIFSARSEMDD